MKDGHIKTCLKGVKIERIGGKPYVEYKDKKHRVSKWRHGLTIIPHLNMTPKSPRPCFDRTEDGLVPKACPAEKYSVSTRSDILPAALTISSFALGFVIFLALARHFGLRRFPKVGYNYVPRPQDTVMCNRPMDTRVTQYLYPWFKHTYLKTHSAEGIRTLGYQYCDSTNENCPDTHGTAVLPDDPQVRMARDPKRHRCWLISTDPDFKECVEHKMNEVIMKYRYPHKYISVLDNACAIYGERVIEECRRETG